MLYAPIPLAVSFLRPSAGRRPLVAGVLSGTSADGIDVVLAEPLIEPSGEGADRLVGLHTAAFATEPFEPELGARVRAVLDGEPLSLAQVARLDRDLGVAFGTAARRVADRHGVGDLTLVASHGQTVFHHDGDPAHGMVTMQLGDGDCVAEAAGTAVVSDFRRRDCASGGQGAPLVALVDDLLFHGAPRPLAVLNLGGMGNWTLLSADPGEVRGFDTGPVGSLLDGLARRRLGQPYDAGGAVAATGAVDVSLVGRWLDHPFFKASAAAGPGEGGESRPRSTGRDTFGEAYVDEIAGDLRGHSDADALATACGFVAESVAQGLPSEDSAARWSVALAGGGVHNARLRAEIQRALGPLKPSTIELSSAYGVPGDAREALAFAALGVRHALGEPSTRPTVTGAAPGRILGKWSPAAHELPVKA